MLVTNTGENSSWGKAIAKLTQEYEDTPLQEKLGVMAGQIGKVGLGAAIITFSALTIFWAVDEYGKQKHHFQANQLIELLDFFIIAVTIVVVAVPEGMKGVSDNIIVPFSFSFSSRTSPCCNNLFGLFYEKDDEGQQPRSATSSVRDNGRCY